MPVKEFFTVPLDQIRFPSSMHERETNTLLNETQGHVFTDSSKLTVHTCQNNHKLFLYTFLGDGTMSENKFPMVSTPTGARAAHRLPPLLFNIRNTFKVGDEVYRIRDEMDYCKILVPNTAPVTPNMSITNNSIGIESYVLTVISVGSNDGEYTISENKTNKQHTLQGALLCHKLHLLPYLV